MDTPLMLNRSEAVAEKRELVVIKKYANRRLYNTETSSYVTLEDLATMVRSDRDFVVYDAKTGDDLTHTVLTQIIVEQESRGNGQQSMLPIPFLRQLIRFYDDGMARMVPGYLQFSLESLAKEQDRFRQQFARAFGNPTAAFDVYQDQVRRNMELFEQALAVWTASPNVIGGPLQRRPGDAGGPTASALVTSPPPDAPPRDEIAELKAQLAAMQKRIEEIAPSKE
jgi:polyhydroxyalkanoate synthesis repressor PhaR